MDTLAFGYILPTTGRIRDFNPLETCAARRTQKKRVCFLLQIGEETNPLRLRCSSDDFSDGMNDTEQQPDEEGKSSDKTAYD